MASRGSRKSHEVADIGSNDAGAGEVKSGCDTISTNHNVSEGPPICKGMYFHLSACVKHHLPTVNYVQTKDVEAQTFDMEVQPSTSELCGSFTVGIPLLHSASIHHSVVLLMDFMVPTIYCRVGSQSILTFNHYCNGVQVAVDKYWTGWLTIIWFQ